ncbi:hypothetical protein L1049_010909 [Liquidambar formosana]|uniref:SHSP domain-containing protein n=1 Tax=Liquidambar formosana TaxID=63359 RepID=A0AAP0RQG6_LIQFO
MAMRPRTSGVPSVRPRPSMRPVYEDFRPMFEWKKDQESDILVVYLPGFMREQVKVTVESPEKIRSYGERPLGYNRRSRFNQDFRIPESCNASGISARFDAGVLSVTMPNKIVQKADGEPKSQEVQEDEATPTSTRTGIEKQRDETSAQSPSPQNATMEPRPLKGQEDTQPKATATMSSGQRQTEKESARAPSPQKPASEPKSQKGEDRPPLGANLTEKQSNERSAVRSADAENVAQKKVEKKESIETKEKATESKKSENAAEKTLDKERESGEKSKESKTAKEAAERIVEKDYKEKSADDKRKAKDDADFTKAKETKNVTAAAAGFKLEKSKKTVEGLLPMKLSEERQALVNMGVAIAVIVALGAYISYFGPYGKAKN